MKSKYRLPIIIYIALVFAAFTATLIVPQSREVFKTLSSEHPFIMGFAKFALLATAGELIAVRMATGSWKLPAKIVARFIIWGVIGAWITLMMKVFSTAVATGILPLGSNEILTRFLKAFYTSVIMNNSFGPTFMAIHKCSDKYLDLRADGAKKIKVADVIGDIDWTKFVNFTLFKTVPLFWIPAHTVTFLLPSEYQVVMAAALSVALGIILNLKK